MFNLQIANQLVQESQSNEFVVDFGGLWQWCGYSRKDKAKEMLVKNFTENAEYRFSTTSGKTPHGGRPSVLIQLTLDAAKAFALLAQTEQGKEVRRYFIEAEKQLRSQAIPVQPKLTNRQVAVELADNVRHITDTLEDNPRLAQLLIDTALMDIRAQPILAAVTLVGVVELAKELGFETNTSTRVKLGQFIASQNFEKFREKRICAGAMREINCYEDTQELREAITTFFTR